MIILFETLMGLFLMGRCASQPVPLNITEKMPAGDVGVTTIFWWRCCVALAVIT